MAGIIDTHLHCWDLDSFDYYWLQNDTSILKRNYSVEDVKPEMDAVGVTSAVLVQATMQIEESDWFLQLAQDHDWIKGAVIWLPLQKPGEVSHLLQTYQKHPFFKGVRHQIHDEPDDEWLLQPDVMESLALLAAANIPFDIVGIRGAHIKTALQVAEQIPGLKMVFDHLVQPPLNKGPEESKEWFQLMQAAAGHRNFFAKVSGLGTTCGKPFTWTKDDIKRFVQFTIDTFGIDRVFCGGDWPVSLLAGSYTYTWQQYKALFDELLNEKEKEKVYSTNAAAFYGLDRLA